MVGLIYPRAAGPARQGGQIFSNNPEIAGIPAQRFAQTSRNHAQWADFPVFRMEGVWRLRAESNRRTRFCRPLTKPLIQGTLSLAIFVSRLRLQRYDIFFNLQIFCYFFLTFSAFFSQPYFGLFCIDFMAQSELQHSHGLLLFFMRLKY